MSGTRDYAENHLLAALLPAERERIFPHLELVSMPLGKVLYESGDVLRHVYFPADCIVSLLYVLENGASAEIRGGCGFSDGGVSGNLPVQYSNRRTEIHEEAKTKPLSVIQGASGPGSDPG